MAQPYTAMHELVSRLVAPERLIACACGGGTHDDAEDRRLASRSAQSTANLVADNVAQLKAPFPELVTEGPKGPAVNLDVLEGAGGRRDGDRRRREVRPELARQAAARQLA